MSYVKKNNNMYVVIFFEKKIYIIKSNIVNYSKNMWQVLYKNIFQFPSPLKNLLFDLKRPAMMWIKYIYLHIVFIIQLTFSFICIVFQVLKAVLAPFKTCPKHSLLILTASLLAKRYMVYFQSTVYKLFKIKWK